MKTTLEIPDTLYREAKTIAARQNLKLKDLFASGLKMAIEEESKRNRYPTPLETFSIVRESPLHTSDEIKAMIAQVDHDRKAGWSDDRECQGSASE